MSLQEKFIEGDNNNNNNKYKKKGLHLRREEEARSKFSIGLTTTHRTMEKLPTDSPSAANKDSVARRSPSRTIRENVHTNVLGRDAGDSAREIGLGGAENSTTDASENKKSGWFGGGIFGGNSDNIDTVNNLNRKRRSNNARYDGLQQTLEDGAAYDPPPLAEASVSSATEATAVTREDRVRQDCSAFYQGVEEDPRMTYHRTRGRRKGRNSAADSDSLLRRMSIRARLSGEVDGALFMSRYERLNQVIPRRKSMAQHLRGQQYTGNDNNSANSINENDPNPNHDLFLDENDQGQPSSYREHIPSPTNNVVMGAANLANPHGVRSSMFFEQDGKMLMRLPRDQVRLVMDYNLEPGILSVEQWRSQEDATAASEKLASQNARTRFSSKRLRERQRKERRRRRRRRKRRQQEKQQEEKLDDDKQALETVVIEEGQDPSDSNREDDDDSYSSYSDDNSYLDSDDDDYFDEDLLPELKYVITIPDDLYRRMVAEMSSKLIPPYWGFFKCCHQESERADIRLALVILAVVMSLLFIGSLEWRTT